MGREGAIPTSLRGSLLQQSEPRVEGQECIMPLTTWTQRDELLSDALHMRDVAMGLANEAPIFEDDYEPLSQVEEEMERALRNANWSKVQDWRDLRQEMGKPNLTADDKDDVATATDRRRLVESRFTDG